MGSNDLDFYLNLVKYMTYTPLGEIPSEIITRVTKQAGVIALINPEINDFGDILSLPAFNETASPSTPVWIIDFLRAIHLGDFDKFETAIATHSTYLKSHESLLMSQIDSSLRRKLVMIALAELAAFKSPEKNRRLRFEDIARTCRIPIDQVETLIMTTIGTGGLIEGVIDEVDSTVIVTSVKPRILDTDRVLVLKSRIENWADRALELLGQLNEATPELLAA
jgi:26S proteasome regulatory subunit N9